MRKSLFLLSSFAVLSSCAPFINSPYSDQLLRPERNLNTKSIAKVDSVETDGKIRIAVMSDSHQNYRSLDQVIYQINQTADVDFVVNLGDLTNSSYNLEYDQFLDSFVTLQRPAVTVIGNHDAIGAGPELFKKAFGDPNFWFESTTHRYIFFHSANLEDSEGFNPSWLQDTVTTSTKPVIIFAHIQLRDAERFEEDVAQTFDTIIKDSKVRMILNGHNHVYGFNMDNSTVMLQCPRTEGNQWLLVEIQGTQLTVTRMDTGENVGATLKP